MSWAKLDDKFHSHPKVLKALGKGAKGVAAICLWALALSWCGSHQTSRVPTAFVSVLGTGKKGADAAKVLVEVGLWQPTEEGFEVRNWHSYQHKQVEPNDPSEHHEASEPKTPASEKQRESTRERVARWRERHHPSNANETSKKTDVTPSVTPLVTGHVTPSNAVGNAPCNAQVTELTVTSETQNTPNALVYTRTHAHALSLTHTQIETAAHTTRTREAVVQAKPAEPTPIAPPAPPSEPTPPPESTERPVVAPKPNPPAQPPTASSTPPQTATSRLEAVLAECSALAPLNRQQLAGLIEGRRMASGKPVAWVEQAIRDADRSAATSALGGEPLSASRLADLVVRYCDHARAPKRTESILSLKEQSNRIDSVIKMINPLMQHEQRIGTNLRVRHPTHPFQPPPQTERTGLCISLTNLLHTCLALIFAHTAAITQATHSNACASSVYTNRVESSLPRDSNKLVLLYP